MIELRHLRHFIQVAELLHMTAAAERLHIAQPALSQSIRALEDSLGVPLFYRRKQRLVLTEAGRAFLAESRKSLEQVERAQTIAKLVQRGEIGQLAIGFGKTVALGILPDVLRRFTAQYPSAELRLRELGSDDQLRGLETGELDLALGYATSDARKFNRKVLRSEKLRVLLPDGHRLLPRKTVALREIESDPLILPRRSVAAAVTDAVLQLYASEKLTPRLAHQIETPQSCYALVAAGLGVSVTVASTGALSLVDVEERPLRDKHPPVELSVFWRKGDESPLVNNFLRLFDS